MDVICGVGRVSFEFEGRACSARPCLPTIEAVFPGYCVVCQRNSYRGVPGNPVTRGAAAIGVQSRPWLLDRVINPDHGGIRLCRTKVARRVCLTDLDAVHGICRVSFELEGRASPGRPGLPTIEAVFPGDRVGCECDTHRCIGGDPVARGVAAVGCQRKIRFPDRVDNPDYCHIRLRFTDIARRV